ncbi:MAG TPA: hypothetical protein PKA19_06165 [Bacillota bacterium]|nr:hypothetical protein [Bacillota bacterium]
MKWSLTIILILLLVFGALTGCGADQKKIQEDFIAILDQPASEDTIKEATDYLDKYLPKMDEDNASQMVHSLEHYILGYNQQGIVYTDWIKKYEKYIDPVLLGLYKIDAEEQASPMMEDTVLLLSWDELAQRTYNLEQFIRENRDYKAISDDLTWLYSYYMNALVMGTNGTPIFDYKTHAFSPDAKTAYAAFIKQHPDSTTAWALTEYDTYLNSIQFTLDYNDKVSSKLFFDTCDWLVTESGKRVFQ